jgi:glycosyltransferase involved in cell wall biosynthesis
VRTAAVPRKKAVVISSSGGMPNAVLEGLAAGRAVIGTHVGGTAEILANGGGILAPSGDPDRLARAIRAQLLVRRRDRGGRGGRG